MIEVLIGIVIGVMLHRKYVRKLVLELEERKAEIDAIKKPGVVMQSPPAESNSF